MLLAQLSSGVNTKYEAMVS